MEIWHGVIWKHFESRVPQGRQNLFVCKCVFVRTCISAFVCVSCVCSTLSPGTSVMPPLSQFLTSLLKKMLIQTKPLLSPLLLIFLLGMDWRRHTFITQSQDVWFSTSLLLFFYFKLYFTIPNHLFPPTGFHERWSGELSIETSWSILVSSVFLYCTANIGSLEKWQLHQPMALANKKSYSELQSICSAAMAAVTDSPMMWKWGREKQVFSFKLFSLQRYLFHLILWKKKEE